MLLLVGEISILTISYVSNILDVQQTFLECHSGVFYKITYFLFVSKS